MSLQSGQMPPSFSDPTNATMATANNLRTSLLEHYYSLSRVVSDLEETWVKIAGIPTPDGSVVGSKEVPAPAEPPLLEITGMLNNKIGDIEAILGKIKNAL